MHLPSGGGATFFARVALRRACWATSSKKGVWKNAIIGEKKSLDYGEILVNWVWYLMARRESSRNNDMPTISLSLSISLSLYLSLSLSQIFH
jgi:hypothetical protein